MSRPPVYTAAVVGTGRIGFSLGFDRKREQPASHTAALLANRRVRIVAGCDRDAVRLEEWGRYTRCAALFSNFAHLFAACRPDIAVIAVNEDAHLEAALAAIRARPRLVILEKPVALTVADGTQIAEEAAGYGVPVLVNHERRFADDYRIARQYVRTIGAVQRINAELDSGLLVYRPGAEASGEYSLLHDGTHLVDVVSYLLEDSDAADGGVLFGTRVSDVYYDKNAPDTVRNLSAHFESEKCPDITVKISGRSRFFRFETDILGTEGRVCIGNDGAQFFRRAPSGLYTGFYSLAPDRSVRLPKKTRYFSNMIQNAVDFLDGSAPLRSTLQTGMQTLCVLEEIRNRLRAVSPAGGM